MIRPTQILRSSLSLLIISLAALVSATSAYAKPGDVTEQALVEGIGWLSPHNPLGGNPWYTKINPGGVGIEKGKIFELNSSFEGTAFEISGTKKTIGNITQAADGNVYFAESDNTVGQAELGTIGRLVPGTGASSRLSLPSPPSNCGIEGPPIPECGLRLATGPGGTLWYTQFKQKEGEHVARLGRVAIGEAGSPITQYNLSNPETRPWDIIEGGGGRLWFTQKFGYGDWPSASWNLAKAVLNAGKLEVSEYAIPNKAPGQLSKGAGENIFLIQNAGENHRILRVNPEGKMTEMPLGPGAKPQGAALGPDQKIWFVEEQAKVIARLSPATEEVARYTVPNPIGCRPIAMSPGHGETMLSREECVNGTTRFSVVATK